jgi:hypothetical protein
MANVKAIRRRIKADVEGSLTFVHEIFDLGLIRYLGNQPTSDKLVVNFHFYISFQILLTIKKRPRENPRAT